MKLRTATMKQSYTALLVTVLAFGLSGPLIGANNSMPLVRAVVHFQVKKKAIDIVKDCIQKTLDWMEWIPKNKETGKILKRMEALKRRNTIPELTNDQRKEILENLRRCVLDLGPHVGDNNWIKINMEYNRISAIMLQAPFI